ncbi:MAG: alpha/beta fold hydrolase [Anaerolineaceae bacterium]|nr:alpha/beta fold hydrolase [Anaerolineaceae bacterium]
MAIVNVNGVNLYYELHGPDNADVIVFSNGIFMSTASWGYQIAAMKEHFRVLVYDCRGMWKSEHPAGPYSMDQHADDLSALLLALDIPSAHVAGISYGGEVSMTFAIKYPHMVKSLIVSSSVSQLDPLLSAIGQSWTAAIQSGNPDTLFEVTLPYNFSESWIAENQGILDASRKKYAEMDFTSVGELMAAFTRLDLTGQLKQINAPTLVLVGEEDILKSRKYAEIIADEIADAELIIIPHAGHAVCLEKPASFNSAILGFVLKHCEVVS